MEELELIVNTLFQHQRIREQHVFIDGLHGTLPVWGYLESIDLMSLVALASTESGQPNSHTMVNGYCDYPVAKKPAVLLSCLGEVMTPLDP